SGEGDPYRRGYQRRRAGGKRPGGAGTRRKTNRLVDGPDGGRYKTGIRPPRRHQAPPHRRPRMRLPLLAFLPALAVALASAAPPAKPTLKPFAVEPPHVSTDPGVRYDYDIVYVRAPRHGDKRPGQWAEFSNPTRMEPGADLMLLHPDGKEELLVSGK